MELAQVMIAISNSGMSNGSEPSQGATLCGLDWHDARSEYDHSVVELLAEIRRCSALALTDEEKYRLLEAAREREQTAFARYKRVLDAESYS